MQLALAGLMRKSSDFNPAMKHVIIISDGDATPVRASTLQGFVDNDIKISTVSVASHGQMDDKEMQRIATTTGGKYYKVTNNRALPRIFQREARKVAKPLIYEQQPIGLIVDSSAAGHQILQGIDPGQLQPIRGYVMTTIKDNSLVEQLIIADKPAPTAEDEEINTENTTVLASWRYGLGKATVFTSGTAKWADTWRSADYYEKFVTQIVRHSMRPVRENANFTVNTEVNNGEVQVVVTALDEDDEPLNNLSMSARGQNPDLDGFDIEFEQESSGRYVGRFRTDRPGNYLFSIFPDTDYDRLVAGVVVPYSSEFTDREPNFELLQQLASLDPAGGEPGQLVEADMRPENIDQLMDVDPFRSGLVQTVGIRDIWPLLLVLAGLAFFADIFLRRVAVGFDWVPETYAWVRMRLFGGDRGAEVSQSVARLQSRKAEVGAELDARRSQSKFEPEADELEEGQRALDAVLQSEDREYRERPRAKQDAAMGDGQEEKLHTSRLLEAKRKLNKGRKPDADGG